MVCIKRGMASPSREGWVSDDVLIKFLRDDDVVYVERKVGFTENTVMRHRRGG